MQPTWQFATLGRRRMTVAYDFATAFSGGSSLRFVPDGPGGTATVPLYALRLGGRVTVTAVSRGGAGYALRIGSGVARPLTASADWRTTRWCARTTAGETHVSVVARPAARQPLNLGQVSIEPGCNI
ncbi:hypothetical protein [Sphingomonas hankookensis]|uniref:hypothetical protein n=1 Tax=Sphingomonas hankookensis TaxID=563996 RepID=UPI003D30272A